MMVLAVVGKFGAVFVTIPSPVIGGIFIIMFGMITAVGLSSLQFVDLNSMRNLFVLGTALFLGMTLPSWVTGNPSSLDVGKKYSLLQMLAFHRDVFRTLSNFLDGASCEHCTKKEVFH